jgi:hypothetical protein
MLHFQNDVLKPFDAIMGKKAIRSDYRKRLTYYLDFRVSSRFKKS